MRQNLRAPAAVFATVASFAGLFAPQTARAVPLEVDDVWREVRAGTRVTSEHGETVFDGQYHTTAPEKFDRTVDVSHLDHLGVYHVWALAEHDTRIELIGNRGIRLEYYDYQAGNGESNLGRFLHSRFLPGSKVRQIHGLHLFDTYRMVRGFPMPKTERQKADFWVKLEEHHQEARKRLGLHPIETFKPVLDKEEETA